MMNITNSIANIYADAYMRAAEWVTTHPVMTCISLAASFALLVVVAVVGFRSLMKFTY